MQPTSPSTSHRGQVEPCEFSEAQLCLQERWLNPLQTQRLRLPALIAVSPHVAFVDTASRLAGQDQRSVKCSGPRVLRPSPGRRASCKGQRQCYCSALDRQEEHVGAGLHVSPGAHGNMREKKKKKQKWSVWRSLRVSAVNTHTLVMHVCLFHTF